MYFLIITLANENRLPEVLMALTEIDAEGTQIVQARNAESLLAFDVPIFAGFQEMFGNKSETSQILFSIVPEENCVDDFIETLKIANIDFIEDGIGDIFLIPLTVAKWRKSE